MHDIHVRASNHGCISITLVEESSNGISGVSEEHSFIINQPAISDAEWETFISAIGGDTIFFTTNSDGDVTATVDSTVDAGRLGVDTTSNGIRIYLDSVTTAAIIGVGGEAASLISEQHWVLQYLWSVRP